MLCIIFSAVKPGSPDSRCGNDKPIRASEEERDPALRQGGKSGKSATRWDFIGESLETLDPDKHELPAREAYEDIPVERRLLARKVLEVCEREEARIGQDLHDTVCQNLRGIGFLVEGLLKQLRDSGLEPEASRVETIRGYLSDTLRETRCMAKGLYPVAAEPGGLMLALDELAQWVSREPGVFCEFHGSPSVVVADNAVAIQAYRIVREAVNNALKHSRAKNVRIELAEGESGNILTVSDDGIGVSPEAGNRDEKLGLRIMNCRAEMIGGALDIHSGDRGGTVVRCVFPTQGA